MLINNHKLLPSRNTLGCPSQEYNNGKRKNDE